MASYSSGMGPGVPRRFPHPSPPTRRPCHEDVKDSDFRPFDRPRPAHHQRPTEATQTSQRRTIRPNSDAPAGRRSPQVVCTVCDARGVAGWGDLWGPCGLSTRYQAVARPGGPFWGPVRGHRCWRGHPSRDYGPGMVKRAVPKPNLQPRCRFRPLEVLKAEP